MQGQGSGAKAEQNPAAAYLDTQRPPGLRNMRSALNRAVKTFTEGRVTDALEFDWSQVDASLVEKLCSVMDEKAIAPATVNQMLSAVRGTMTQAWRQGLVDAETLLRVKDIPNLEVKRSRSRRHVGKDEIRRLFRMLHHDHSGPAEARDAAAIALLYGGLRRTQAVKVQVEDYDQAAGTVTVRGGAGGEQQVRITAGKDAIDRWLQIRGHHPGALLVPVLKGGRVVQSGMTGSALAQCLKTVAERAGVSSLTPTDLRQSGGRRPD